MEESYNEVSGCEDVYKWILLNVMLFEQDVVSIGDSESYLDTKWAANVSCDGCAQVSNRSFALPRLILPKMV